MVVEQSKQNVDSKAWMKPFFFIFGGQVFSLLGSSVVQFSLIWWLTEKTGSAAVLTAAMLVGFLPEVVLGPFVGALVDRWNRRRVMILADSLVAVVTVVLIALVWGDQLSMWPIFAALFLRSLGGVFHFTAMQASISLMVPENELSRVAGINQALRGVVNIIGPLLAAFLMGVLPFWGVLAVDVVTAFLAVVPLLIVVIPSPQSAGAAQSVKSVLADVREGLRYVRQWNGLFLLLVMATLLNFLFMPAFALMPLLVTEHFQGGALQLGWMESMFGVGIVIGGLALGAWGGFKRRIYTTMLGLMGMALGLGLVWGAPAQTLGMALAGMLLTGINMPIVNGPLFAIVQARVEPAMQGRVFSLMASISGAAVPLSMVIAGPTAELIGVRVWFLVAAVGCVLLSIGGALTPAIINLENEQQPRVQTEAAPNVVG